MKLNLIKTFFGTVIFLFIAQASVFGQKVTIKPFALNASTLLEDVKALKTSNPKISTEELVKSANELLQTKGLNYSFALDAGVCKQVSELQAKQKPTDAPINLNAKLNSFEGDPANVTLPPFRFGRDANQCFSSLPLLEVTQNDFITFIQNRTVKFYKPQNFNFNEVVLVDNKTPATNVRSWKVPFCTTPFFVSEDGKKLYLNLPAAELGDLVLIVYDEGMVQFYPKKDVDLTEKGILLENLPTTLNLPGTSFISFGTGEKQRVLKFGNDCR